jgi:hypothetical protein
MFWKKLGLDKIAEIIAALGIPGLILVIAIACSGYAGGAAIVAALATLGGPFGMLGGLALLGILVLISNAIATYGAEAIVKKVIAKLKKDGLSKEEILKKIDSYPISMGLRLKAKDYIEKYWDTI